MDGKIQKEGLHLCCLLNYEQEIFIIHFSLVTVTIIGVAALTVSSNGKLNSIDYHNF